jgi:hypothetical protein
MLTALLTGLTGALRIVCEIARAAGLFRLIAAALFIV